LQKKEKGRLLIVGEREKGPCPDTHPKGRKKGVCCLSDLQRGGGEQGTRAKKGGGGVTNVAGGLTSSDQGVDRPPVYTSRKKGEQQRGTSLSCGAREKGKIFNRLRKGKKKKGFTMRKRKKVH